MALIVGHACLRSCAAERAAGGDEHRQPTAAIRGDIVDVFFQCTAGAFQFTDFCERRRGEIETVVEEFPGIVELVAQRADPIEVVDAKQVVRFVEAGALRSEAGADVSLQPAIHQHAAPSIGAGIGEDAECRPRWGRILRPFKEADFRIEQHMRELGGRQRS
ncbi:hypothetical protein WK47_30860 [Burkholderia ubonensis]|nr:hypothetical protein WK46_18505 [Burkholderia ubonensis]KVT15911.1 hypothetical protein WK47_30860 [Burkholderia ubonensis]